MSVLNEAKKRHSFRWKGINRKGVNIAGELQAFNVHEVKQELRKQHINVITIKQKKPPLFSLEERISSVDISLFSRQIATLLNAGVPLVQSLEIVAKSHEKKSLRRLIDEITHAVSNGVPYSQALRQHPTYFESLYCNLIEVGEHSGALDILYERISTYQEKSEKLKSKVKKAMLYPAAVLTVAIAVTLLLLLFVIPQFKQIYQGFDAELPAFTLFVLSISDFIKHHGLFLLGGMFTCLFIGKRAHQKSQKVKDINDLLLLRLPVIGTILHKAAIARFTRTLATTASAGIPLVEALISAANASGNYRYRTAIYTIREEVIQGMQINSAMKLTPVFPNMVTQMVMIGEESGHLDDMLNKVAMIYEQQVDDAVDGLTSLLEPLIMVLLGVVVGALIIAMYLPIFKLGSVMG